MQVQNSIAGAIARTYTRQAAGTAPGVAQGAARAVGRRPRTDSVSLSSTTQELMRLRGAVAEAPDVRAERIAALKTAIRGGTYRTDADTLAAKLLG